MKIFKVLVVTLSAILFTGCYTQLQYSQRMHSITEQRETDNYDEQDYEGQVEEGEYYGDEYMPVYYKDYETAEFWAECDCNPYRDYYFYDGYSPYIPYNSWSYRPYHGSFHYGWTPYWSWRNRRYFNNTFAFSISFHWGIPHYYNHHSFFHDLFFYSTYYHPFYGYRYYYPTAYNYYTFYNSPGYFNDDNNIIKDNRRYGPRSIGTNRVSDRSERIRTRNGRTLRDRSNTVRSRSTVRTRSVGSSRSRGTVTRTRGSSVRSRGNDHSVRTRNRGNNQSSRIRSRGNLQRIDSRNERAADRQRSIQRVRDQRSENIIRPRTIDLSNNRLERINYRRGIEERLRDMRIPKIDYDRIQRSRSQPTFFQRLKSYFDSNGRISNRNSRSNTIRMRIPSSTRNRSTVDRSRSSNRSSVTRSRSSSSNSRSRGTSSRSRSRSDGDSSSSRSRGN